MADPTTPTPRPAGGDRSVTEAVAREHLADLDARAARGLLSHAGEHTRQKLREVLEATPAAPAPEAGRDTSTRRDTMWQLGEFHTRNGLTFRRNDDGSMRVRVYPGGNINAAPVLDVTLPENEWGSVVRETAWAAVHKRPADEVTSG